MIHIKYGTKSMKVDLPNDAVVNIMEKVKTLLKFSGKEVIKINNFIVNSSTTVRDGDTLEFC